MNSGSCTMLLGFKRLWIILSVLQETDAIRCPHCNEDFISLGRHTWRCKGRISSIAPAQTVNENRHTNSADQPGNTTNTTTTNFPTPINECSIIMPCELVRRHIRTCSTAYTNLLDVKMENLEILDVGDYNISETITTTETWVAPFGSVTLPLGHSQNET